MDPDTGAPVHYRAAADRGTTAVVLLGAALLATGTTLTLTRAGLPGWFGVPAALAGYGAVGYAALWALGAQTVLEPEHVRVVDALSTRTLPWAAIGAVHPAPIAR